jgi:plastocyanin
MRTLRALSVIVAALALAACSSPAPGWTYAPAPSATPIPSVAPSGSAAASASPAPSSAAPSSTAPSSAAPSSAAPSGSASASASASGGGGTTLEVEAENIAFKESTLAAPADQGFKIDFKNQDQGTPHNVEIKDSSGASKFRGEIITGPAEATYDVPALPAGSYTFVCSVHPNMTGTLTAG